MKSIFILLRFPFSLFLLPVYLFSLGQNKGWSPLDAWLLGILWHGLVYPASNAYNSYYDRDEGPIGGVARPPAVTKNLYWVATTLDVAALVFVGVYWHWQASVAVVGYILMSRAYSSYPIRLKQYPWISWLVVGFFQGTYVFEVSSWLLTGSWAPFFPALLASGMLWAIYPITQVYQHEEDAKRGDQTLSRILGIRGTFLFTAIVFGLTTAGFLWYWPASFRLSWLVFQSPVLFYFLWWSYQVFQDPQQANHTKTMQLNFWAAICLNSFFLYVLLK